MEVDSHWRSLTETAFSCPKTDLGERVQPRTLEWRHSELMIHRAAVLDQVSAVSNRSLERQTNRLPCS